MRCPRCDLDDGKEGYATLCQPCRGEVLEWAEDEAAAAAQYREETGWKPKGRRS